MPEVPLIERQYIADSVPLGKHDERSIGKPERRIGKFLDDRGRTA